MPITQAQGAFNVGRDCQIVIQHPFAPGGQIQIPNVTGFQAQQQTTAIKSLRLDGVNLTAKLPMGWTGSFMADRGSSGVDDLFALIEAAWYGTGAVPPATMFQYITETNNSTSTYQYTGVSLDYSQAGEWRGDQIVKQTVTYEAFRRLKV